MRISDWSSDVCSSDLGTRAATDSVDGAKCPEAIAALSHPIVSWSYELSISLADARFLFDRATGLIRRGWLSLRTRGLRASWHRVRAQLRSEEHTSELQSLMRISYDVFSLNIKTNH